MDIVRTTGDICVPKRRGGNADASSGYPFSLNVKGLFGCISMCKRVPYFRIRENGGEANSRWRIKDAAGGACKVKVASVCTITGGASAKREQWAVQVYEPSAHAVLLYCVLLHFVVWGKGQKI